MLKNAMEPQGQLLCKQNEHNPHAVDMARQPSDLLLKEAIHIHMTPVEEHLNRDTVLELPECWVAALRRQEGMTNQTSFNTHWWILHELQ